MFKLKPKGNAQIIFEVAVYSIGAIISLYNFFKNFIAGTIEYIYLGLLGCFIFSIVVMVKKFKKNRKNELEFIARYNELIGDSDLEDEMNDTDNMILDELFEERDFEDE